MADIGVTNLLSRDGSYAMKFLDQYIVSSSNIKNSIKSYVANNDTRSIDDDDLSDDDVQRRNLMVAFIRDTYICNLLLGYSGTMSLISDDPIFEEVDARITKYVDDFYNDAEFRRAICIVYKRFRDAEHHHEIHDNRTNTNQKYIEYIRFLERVIDRLQPYDSPSRMATRTKILSLESKIFNLLSVTPLLIIDEQKITDDKKFKDRHKIDAISRKLSNKKIEVPLTNDAYYILMSNIGSFDKSSDLSSIIENKYRSRVYSTLKDFAELIVHRKLFAKEMGYDTFFKYQTRDKRDTSDAIKKLITTLNANIDNKVRAELTDVYEYTNRHTERKITDIDITKYIKTHGINTSYDKYTVMYYIFQTLKTYFNISVRKHDTSIQTTPASIKTDLAYFKIFDLIVGSDSGSDKTTTVLGRLYMDIDNRDSKKIVEPISIKLSDRMVVYDDSSSASVASAASAASTTKYTVPEIALLANYGSVITYSQIVQLFREFGYIVQELCYKTGVGLVNRDPEFCNFLPLFMENVAYDRSTVNQICRDPEVSSLIIAARNYTMCYNLKLKCINAKFDHLLHNSDDVIQILATAMGDTHNGASDNTTSTIISRLYDTICGEAFEQVSDLLDVGTTQTGKMLPWIDPLSIVLEINGSQGLLYSSIMNEIFAYGCFYIIKNSIKSNDEFRSILEDGLTPFRDLIHRFMSVHDLNPFNLYVSQLLGISKVSKAQARSHNDVQPNANMDISEAAEIYDDGEVYGETYEDTYDEQQHEQYGAYYSEDSNYVDSSYVSACNNFDEVDFQNTEDMGSVIRIKRG